MLPCTPEVSRASPHGGMLFVPSIDKDKDRNGEVVQSHTCRHDCSKESLIIRLENY